MGRVVRFDRSKGAESRKIDLRCTLLLIVVGDALGYVSLDYSPSIPGPLASSACNIKGNISVTGERIYDMPEQRYYNQTVILAQIEGVAWLMEYWFGLSVKRRNGSEQSPFSKAARCLRLMFEKVSMLIRPPKP
jgi:hypothetical protein